MPDDRLRLRTTFDSASELYQQARPEYPEQLYDDLVEATEITAGDQLLEVGCATGKATLPLARRAFRITCIEIGAELVASARRNLAGFPNVQIVQGDFETWRPPSGARFDLVFAATVWHWIDPATRYRLAWTLLRRGGHLAFWGAAQVVPEGGDTFFAEIQDVYDEIGEALPEDAIWPRPGELPDSRGEIQRSGLFEAVAVRHYDWEAVYNADEYIRLLDTFSGHISMESWQRERLYGEIRRRLAERANGRLRRHWGAVLHVARRRDKPAREPPAR
jgi:SAM-dependent methyltransferase